MARQWQYKALKGISKALCLLSYDSLLTLGKGLSPIYGLVAKKQKNRAIRNVMRGLGCSSEKAHEIVDTMFVKLTQTVLELFYIPKLSHSFIEKHIEVEGLHYLEDAVADNKGVVVLTAHIGNWEWMGAKMADLGFPSTTIVKNQPNEQFTRFINEYRQGVGLEVFARDGADLLKAARAMKQKKCLGFLADQDGGPEGLPIIFFNKMSSAPQGPAVFAKRFKAPVVPIFITRTEKGHKVHVLPKFYYEEREDADAIYELTERCVQLTEDFIRQYPTEWLWFQHRWKTTIDEMENYEQYIGSSQQGEQHEKK